MVWRAWQDLNLRHLAPEASALSTELQAPYNSDTRQTTIVGLRLP